MRRINGRGIFMILSIISYIIISLIFLITNLGSTYYRIINPIFWIIMFVLSLFLFRDEHVNKKYKLDIIQTVIICLIIYFVIYYMSGFISGFADTNYSTTIKGILLNLWSFGSLIIFQEYIRKVLINRCGRNKWMFILVTILFIFNDIHNSLITLDIKDFADFFKYVIVTFNPVVAKNIMLSYLAYKSDYIPGMIYRLFMETYSFIIPFVPNYNWFLLGVVELIMPFIIYFRCHRITVKREDKKEYKKNYKRTFFYVPMFIIIVVLAILVSGVFKYQLIAIGSDSMNPSFYRGDALIFEKIDLKKDKIKVGEVVVFQNDETVIVHRIIEKKKAKSGKNLYITKGDNNNAPDSDVLEEDMILGKTKMIIKFIGYPSVWLQEFFK